MTFAKLREACQNAGIDEVEIYKVEADGFSIYTFNGEVEDNSVSHQVQLYIRGVYDGHITALYAEKDDDGEIPSIVSRLKANAAVTESDDPYFIFGGSPAYPTVPESKHDFDEYTQEERVAICQKMEAFVREQSPYADTTEAAIDASYVKVSIENTSGLSVSRVSAGANLICAAVHKKDGDVKQGYYVDAVDSLKDIDFDKLKKAAVDRPLSSIGAKSIPSGSYPVVFENKQFSSLLSCFLSAFSGEAVTKKVCLLADKLNEKVFGENITIVDNPFTEHSRYHVPFDDEGVATSQKTVVENGVLKTYLHSLKTAKMLGAEPTGNGFKGGGGNIGVSPTNLCIKSGDKTFEQLIAPIQDGVLITSMMGQHAGVNPVSGAFNLQASGYRIQEGKVGDPITLFVVSGNIVDLLNRVVEIGGDLECSQRIVTGSVFVENLSISGQ